MIQVRLGSIRSQPPGRWGGWAKWLLWARGHARERPKASLKQSQPRTELASGRNGHRPQASGCFSSTTPSLVSISGPASPGDGEDLMRDVCVLMEG